MITKFYVQKLFGLYDNTVEFNLDDKITILLGPNGCGKTTMLVMLEAILSLKHIVLNKYKFDYIELDIDDKVLKIQKNPKYKKQINTEHMFIYSINGKEIKFRNKRGINHIEDSIFYEKVYDSRPDDICFIRENGYYLLDEERLERKHRIVNSEPPEEIEDLLSKYKDDAYFISTNRIITTIKNNEYRNKSEIINTIQVFSDELKILLKNELTNYANVSQKLDEEFPSKVLKAINQNRRDSIESLIKKINKTNDMRSNILSSGILEHNSENWLKVDINNADDSTLSMLTIYYEDTEKKLKLLSNLSDKLLLFLNMVNHKLGENKTIKVSSTSGIQIHQVDNDSLDQNIIDLENLSSGEQQEIILLYQLVFKTTDKHFLLIDEPEISLHVNWQRQFIADLRKIIQINNFNIIIATHSPQIINDNWKLTNILGEVD